MSFISYAQNFEDVMLWRALGDVQKGFYIDVGAHDPEVDSVTKAFYDRGWSGINIEPISAWSEKLEKARPNDITLKVAAGDHQGSIAFHEIPNTGLSTSNDEFARRAQANGISSKKIEVPVERLEGICAKHARSTIHFLKIDVEGAEESVIKGMDFERFRPWILLIETNEHIAPTGAHTILEDSIRENGYLFAYADGLNIFYVAKERAELLDKLRYPPNIFDDFIPVKQIKAALQTEQAEERSRQAEERSRQAEERSRQAEERCQAIVNSRSWRVSAPLRFMAEKVRWFARGLIAWITLKPGCRPRRIARRVALFTRDRLVSRPKLLTKVLSALEYFPRLRDRLKALHHENPISDSPQKLVFVNTAAPSKYHFSKSAATDESPHAIESALLESIHKWSKGRRL